MDQRVVAEISRKIHKDEINHLPLMEYSGPVLLVDSRARMDEALECLQGERVLGFDTETRPSFKKGVSYQPSLVQLAAREVVYLFQVQHLADCQALADLLANADVKKVGVAPDQDIKQLHSIFPFEARGFLDLGRMAQGFGIYSQGLRSMAAAFFGVRISKKAQCSNWSRKKLDDIQIRYAATDAWISREIYYFLRRIEREGGGTVQNGELPGMVSMGAGG